MSSDLVFTFHYNRADNIYEFAPAEWAKVNAHIAKLEKEHIEDVNRMERAAIVIEDLTRQVNENKSPAPETCEGQPTAGAVYPAHRPRNQSEGSPAAEAVADETAGRSCPTCRSPEPHRHPTNDFGEPSQSCKDEWHRLNR